MAGRPNKYYSNIEPRLAEIEKLALTMTEAQIAKVMGVGITSWQKYKKQFPKLVAALKKGRHDLVDELKSTMIMKAKGFHYEERKKVLKDGKVVQEEIYEKYSLPDLGAEHLLLKNYDEDWSNDPKMLEIRKKELELREKQIENNSW